MKSLVFFVVLLIGAVAATNDTEVSGETNYEPVYVNCKPDDLYEDTEVQISSIVDFVLKRSGVLRIPKEGEDRFQIYIDGLGKLLGNSEPYVKTIRVRDISHKDVGIHVVRELLDGVNFKTEDLKVVATKIFKNLVSLVLNNKEPSVDFNEKSKVFLQIFTSGSNIEFVPTNMKVTVDTSSVSNIITELDKVESVVSYREQKFILTTFDIKHIVKRIKKE